MIDLLRYVCAHDVGLIVNPDTLQHVIDRHSSTAPAAPCSRRCGSTRHGHQCRLGELSGAACGRLPAAAIDIVLIDRPEEAPSGAAEMALGLVPAAIGNAVFDATGVRLRRVPFTPERVKAALEKT